MQKKTPEWAKVVLDNPVYILTAARCCMSSGVECEACPFGAWYDCYDILREKVSMLIEKEKEKQNALRNIPDNA